MIRTVGGPVARQVLPQVKLLQGTGENVQCQVRKKDLNSFCPDPQADVASWDLKSAAIRV